jgi:hypothetical protein
MLPGREGTTMKTGWMVLFALCAGGSAAGCDGDSRERREERESGGLRIRMATEEDHVRSRFGDFIAAAGRGDGAATAPIILYRGPDETRKWKDVCDWSRESDRPFVESAIRRFAEIRKAGPLRPKGFRREKESEGEWLILLYEAGGQPVSFAFLAVGDSYALGDID